MKNQHEALQISPLFRGIALEDMDAALKCLETRQRQYRPGETILLAGQPAGQVGILLDGRAQIIREEYSGTRTILAELVPGELFGEAFACASGEEKILPVTVFSVTGSVILFIDCQKIIRPSACPWQTRLIENLLAVMADKNLMLNRRLAHLSKRTTREKLLSYLSEQAAGKTEFSIPFSRQELADYLCVERSAMSCILSKLRAEGILEAHRNHFRFKIAGKKALFNEEASM